MINNFFTKTLLIAFCCLFNLSFLIGAAQKGESLRSNPEAVMGEDVYYSAFPKLPIDSDTSFDAEARTAKAGNIDSMMKCATMCVYTDDPLTVSLSMAYIYYRMAACKGDEENVQGDLRKQCAAAALTCAVM